MFQSLISKFGSTPSSSKNSALDKKDDLSSYSVYWNRLEIGQVPRCRGFIARNNQAVFSLTDFQVDAVVSDATVTTVMTQRYKNSSKTPVESKYEMPLPPSAAVSKFVVTFDDKVLIAKIKERQAAVEKYDDAIASGNQAFLVEKNSSGTFSTVIGNIPPGKEVTVNITIVSEIGIHLEDYHFNLHRFMFPDQRFSFTFNLAAKLSTPIQSVEVDGWSSVKKSIDNNSATVNFTSTGVSKNIIVSIKPVSSEKPSYFLERSAESPADYAIGINFYPNLKIAPEDVDQHSEFIFLIDCSGSMSGTQIQKAKSALEILMRSLNEKSKFNIWLFGSSYKSLFKTSNIYSDATLEQASKFISEIDANLGGTELYAPLKSILAQEYDPQYPRQLFILTDGEISDRDTTIDLAGKNSSKTRIFTLGIGSGVDRDLVIGLSKSCKGYYDFIDSNNEMETRVMNLMSVAMEPIISNIKVEWGDLEVTQAPKALRPIYSKERMLISALIKPIPADSSLNKTIVITADGPKGTPLRYEIPVDFSQAQATGTSLQTLAAQLVIGDLEYEEFLSKDKKHKDTIVALGKKYNLISNHTSFVVVSESDTPIEETMKTVNVMAPEPVQHTSRLSMPGGAPPVGGGGGGRGGALPHRSPAPMGMMRRVSSSSSSSSSSQTSAIPQSSMRAFAPPPAPSTFSSTISADDCLESYDCESGGSDNDLDEFMPAQQSSLKKTNAPEKAKKEMSRSLKIEGISFDKKDKDRACEEEREVSVIVKSGDAKAKPKTFTSTGNLMMDLIRFQNANGSWDGPLPFASSAALPAELTATPNIWFTLLVIAKFNKEFADKKAQWQQIVIKATKWVKSQLAAASLTDKFDSLQSQAQSKV